MFSNTVISLILELFLRLNGRVANTVNSYVVLTVKHSLDYLEALGRSLQFNNRQILAVRADEMNGSSLYWLGSNTIMDHHRLLNVSKNIELTVILLK